MNDESESLRRRSFAERLAQPGCLVADGATGTNYQDLGLEPGVAPEEWLFEEPARVRGLHEAFIEAGAEVILTCSFGATGIRLEDGPLAGRGREVNLRAAELAHDASRGRALVAGSLGPTGQLCEPLGPLTLACCADEYAAQAESLVAGGVELLVLETFFALEEAIAAIQGVQRVTDCPLVVSFSFDQGTRTMMGVSPTQAVAAVLPFGPVAVGANCGRSLDDMAAIVPELVSAAGELPVWIKPNAGVPKIVGDAVVYEADAAMMAEYATRFLADGARIVGGCCGSTPAHIAAIAAAVSA